MLFSIFLWIIFGAIVGWIANTITRRKTGVLGNIVVGIVGALIGGFILNAFGAPGLTGFNLSSLIVGIIGAILLLVVVGWLRPKRTADPKTPPEEIKSADSADSERVQPKKETRIPSMQEAISSLMQRQKETAGVPTSSAGKAVSGIIFISYRRTDSAHVAGRIYDRLVEGFGRVAVFKDVDSIPLGLDFKEYLDEKVGQCNVLLAIIGDRWLEARDPSGKSRLQEPNDFVRIEIESALARGIPVIPLLVDGAPMPSEENLPPSLRKLVYRNGISIRPDPDFHRDMDRLISALKAYL